MNPFTDCKPIYSKHCTKRMIERDVTTSDVVNTLRAGKVSQKSGTYRVTLKTIQVRLVKYTCRIILKTVVRQSFGL